MKVSCLLAVPSTNGRSMLERELLRWVWVWVWVWLAMLIPSALPSSECFVLYCDAPVVRAGFCSVLGRARFVR